MATSGDGVLAWGSHLFGQAGGLMASPPDVLSVAGGETVTFAVCAGGDVFAWGTPTYEEAPSAACGEEAVPRPVALPVKVTSVAAAWHHVAAVSVGGELWVWGRNKHGQLGVGDTPAIVAKPARASLPGGAAVSSVAVGRDHTLCVTVGGGVWAAGSNKYGQCGAATPAVLPPPSRLPSFAPVACFGAARPARSVAAGCCHSAVVAADGGVWTFGWGLYSQLGLGDATDKAAPTLVEGLLDVGGFRPDGTANGVTAVACGAWHTVAVSAIGDVYTWGWGKHGQLGRKFPLADRPDAAGVQALVDTARHPEPTLVDALSDENVVHIAAGTKHTVAVTDKGRVWAWGMGALPSTDATTLVPTPQLVPDMHVSGGLACGTWHTVAAGVQRTPT